MASSLVVILILLRLGYGLGTVLQPIAFVADAPVDESGLRHSGHLNLEPTTEDPGAVLCTKFSYTRIHLHSLFFLCTIV